MAHASAEGEDEAICRAAAERIAAALEAATPGTGKAVEALELRLAIGPAGEQDSRQQHGGDERLVHGVILRLVAHRQKS